jgi:hypothetical protein
VALNGTVNPNGSDTTARFEFGLTVAYGSVTDELYFGSGTVALAVVAGLSQLACPRVYHYRAVATNANGSSAGSDMTFTTLDCHLFTDDPVTKDTVIKVVHFTELRQAIDTLRTRYGLAAYSWTDPTLTPGASLIQAQHLLDLRAALVAAYVAAGVTPPVFADPGLGQGSPIKAIDIVELRTAVRLLEDR